MLVHPESRAELEEAEAENRQAQTAWREAQLKAWRAPAGKRQAREEAARAATLEALQAELNLTRARRAMGGSA